MHTTLHTAASPYQGDTIRSLGISKGPCDFSLFYDSVLAVNLIFHSNICKDSRT